MRLILPLIFLLFLVPMISADSPNLINGNTDLPSLDNSILTNNTYNVNYTTAVFNNSFWDSNYSSFLLKINWSQAINGTLMLQTNWNATNTSYMTYANWNSTNTSYRTLDNLTFLGGNVGIGTASPTGRIHVVNDANVYPSLLLEGGAKDFAWATGENLQIGTWNGTTFSQLGVWEAGGNLGIGTTTPSYKLQVGNGSATNYSLISAYFEGNITSAGYITRTSNYDLSKGSALNFIQNADYYNTLGKVDDTKFFGYTTWVTKETDFSKPTTETYIEQECTIEVIESIEEGVENTEQEICIDVEKERIVYNSRIDIENKGVSLDAEINLLRQSVYELKTENTAMKSSLCKLGETQWC